MRLLEDASWEKYAAEEYNIEETQPAVLPRFFGDPRTAADEAGV